MCADEQELDMRHVKEDEQTRHCEVQNFVLIHVDSAGVHRRLFTLPGEALPLEREEGVSRGHSKQRKRADERIGETHLDEGPNVK